MAQYNPKAEYRHCFESAAAAAGWKGEKDKNADAKLMEAFHQVRGRMAGYVRDGMSERDAAIRAGKELGEQTRAAAQVEKLNALKNAARFHALLSRVESRAADIGGEKRLYHALLPEITASVRVTDTGAGRLSTEAMQRALAARRLALIETDLRRAGLLAVARGGSIDGDIGREMYEHSLKDSGEPSNIGRTGNEQAQRIAEIFRKHLVDSWDELNKRGAWIGNYAGYILRSSWDPGRMLKGATDEARERWIADALALADPRTFDGLDDPHRWLREVWQNITSGIHTHDSEGIYEGFKNPAFKGPANLAGKLSGQRVLHWKDADAWATMMDRYGRRGTMMERLYGTLDRQARQAALLDRWGTNPRYMLGRLIGHLNENAKKEDPKLVLSRHQQHAIEDMFGDVDGRNSEPGTTFAAKFGTYSRAIESMAKLGGVLFTHFNALGTGTSALAYHGVPYLTAYREAFANLLRPWVNRDDETYQAILDTVGAGMEGVHGAAVSGWMGDDVPGTLSKISHHYFNLTGLTPMLKAVKNGVTFTMSRELARNAHVPYDDLRPEIRNSFKLFGITPEDWEALRTAPNKLMFRGKEYLTPDDALRAHGLSDEQRAALRDKLGAYYMSLADEYTITPTLYDKRMARLGQSISPNTWLGQVLRFIAQFKQWPAAAIRQGVGRELMGRKVIGGKFGGLAHLILATTALGYLRMMLADTSEGIEPPKPDAKAFGAALAQGGGMGIMGDFLFGQQNRFGQSLAETAAGPVMGEAAQSIMRMWNNAREAALTGDNSKLDKLPSEGLRLGLQNTPFINLFYVRGALNYLLLDSLQESLDPGYLERRRRAMQKNEGRQYLAPSTPILGLFNPANHLRTFGQ